MPSKTSLRKHNCLHFKPSEENALRKATKPNEPILYIKHKKTSRLNKDSIGVHFLGYAAGKPPAATIVRKSISLTKSPSGRMRELGNDAKYWWVTGKGKLKHKTLPVRDSGPLPDGPTLNNRPTAGPPATGNPLPHGPSFGGTWYAGHWFNNQSYHGHWYEDPWFGFQATSGRGSRHGYSEHTYESVTESLRTLSLRNSNNVNVFDFLDRPEMPATGQARSAGPAVSTVAHARRGSSRSESEIFFDTPAAQSPAPAPNGNSQMIVRNSDTRMVALNDGRPWSSDYPQELMPNVTYNQQRLSLYLFRLLGF